MQIISGLLFICSMLFIQYQCNWYMASTASNNITLTNHLVKVTLVKAAIGTLSSNNILSHIGFWYPLPMLGITEQKERDIFQTKELITKLYNAQPNPFKNQTTIQYSIPLRTKVALQIYDISGRLVRTFVNNEQAVVKYKINWDSKTDRTQPAVAGIYFYKLHTPNTSATKKLLLIE